MFTLLKSYKGMVVISLSVALFSCTANTKNSSDANPPAEKIETDTIESSDSLPRIELGVGLAVSETLEVDSTSSQDQFKHRWSKNFVLKTPSDIKARLKLKNLKSDCLKENLVVNAISLLHDETSTTTHSLDNLFFSEEYDLGTIGAGTTTFNFMAIGSTKCSFSFELLLEKLEVEESSGQQSSNTLTPGETNSGDTVAGDTGATGEDTVPVIHVLEDKTVVGSWAAASLNQGGYLLSQIKINEDGTGTLKNWFDGQTRLATSFKKVTTSIDGNTKKLTFEIQETTIDADGAWPAGAMVLCDYDTIEKKRFNWRCSKPGNLNFPTTAVVLVGLYHGPSNDSQVPYIKHQIFTGASLPTNSKKFLANTMHDEIIDFEITSPGTVLGIQIYAKADLKNTDQITLTIDNIYDDRPNTSGTQWFKAQNQNYYFYSMGYDTKFGGQFSDLTGTKMNGKWTIGYSNMSAFTETLQHLEVMIFGVK